MSEAITTGEGTAAYDAAKNSPTRSAFMYFPTNSRRELTPYTRREIVKKGRAFEANCAFATRIRQKFARHAVGSGIHFACLSNDDIFNEAMRRDVEEWWNNAAVYSIDASVDVAYDSVPGGTHTVPVSGGPPPREKGISAARVAAGHLNKVAVYWAAKGRQYRPCKTEIETGKLTCPRCEDAYLRKTLYKMEEGARVKLFVCPECLFIVRRDDVLGFEE